MKPLYSAEYSVVPVSSSPSQIKYPALDMSNRLHNLIKPLGLSYFSMNLQSRIQQGSSYSVVLGNSKGS